MKEYKYKINGNSYKVTIGDIEDNIAHVEVNGTPYKVEMEKAPQSARRLRQVLWVWGGSTAAKGSAVHQKCRT